MKTYNIWQYKSEWIGPTGRWKFMTACKAENEGQALRLAYNTYGEGKFNVYEGL